MDAVNKSWALVIIDMINDLEGVDGANELLKKGLVAARRIATLKKKLKAKQVPVIYANDNFGQWRSDFGYLLRHCLEEETRGRPLVELLLPEKDDYFVLKPMHSAFYSTTLETLLSRLGTKNLILAGMTANQCVLFTANDAHMRGFHVAVPRDCLVARNAREEAMALFHFRQILRVDTTTSPRINLRSGWRKKKHEA